MTSEESAPLIERIRAGDSQALAQFVEANRWQLLAYIQRRLGPALRAKVEPEDLLQETSAEAVRMLANQATSDRDPFSWLCQIAEHRIVDAHRRYIGAEKRAAGREVPMASPSPDTSRLSLADMLVASMTTASQAFSRNQWEIQLEQALATLPVEQREALRMKYVEGLPSKQIAERLGKSDGAVRVMLTRSLAKLQEILGPR